MRKLGVFDSVSLDGFLADAKSDMNWTRKRVTIPSGTRS
jgi:hypothetical protein